MEGGYDVRAIQEFLGHREVKATMITRVALVGCGGTACSPRLIWL